MPGVAGCLARRVARAVSGCGGDRAGRRHPRCGVTPSTEVCYGYGPGGFGWLPALGRAQGGSDPDAHGVSWQRLSRGLRAEQVEARATLTQAGDTCISFDKDQFSWEGLGGVGCECLGTSGVAALCRWMRFWLRELSLFPPSPERLCLGTLLPPLLRHHHHRLQAARGPRVAHHRRRRACALRSTDATHLKWCVAIWGC